MILNYLKRNEKNMIFSTVLTMILGIVLIINPEGSMKFVTILLSCVFFLFGIYEIIDYFKKNEEERLNSISLILGVVLLAIGVYLFIKSELLINFITTVIGFTIGLKSLFKLQYAFNMRKVSKNWITNILVALLGIAFSVILVINPFKSATIFLRIMGALFILGGILEIFESIKIIKELNSLINDGGIKEIEEVEKK